MSPVVGRRVAGCDSVILQGIPLSCKGGCGRIPGAAGNVHVSKTGRWPVKTEAEIREFIAALKKARNSPCDCRGEPHETKCYMGGRMMDASIDTLLWVLGESESAERVARVLIEGNR